MVLLAKGRRITGPVRSKLASDLRGQYDRGRSIRELASTHGRSYGFIHRLLSESGATLRGRGGPSRLKAKTTATPKKATSAPAEPAKSAPAASAKVTPKKGT
jgi:hypothetical protein